MKNRTYAVALGACLLTACAARQQKAAAPVPVRPLPAAIRPGVDVDEDEEEEAEASQKAFENFRLRRSPDGELPVERYREAQKHKASMRAFSTVEGHFADASYTGGTAQLPTWTFVGPANISGRTRSILIDPNTPTTMYAGAVTGGVWKTVNGGTTWISLTDSFPLAFVSTMAMDPTNSQTIYAGTGEYSTGYRGLGVLKTTNGGNTWTLLPSTENSGFYFVNKIQVSKGNPQHIYAATSTGVMFSPDGGNTWTTSLALTSNGLINACHDVQVRSDQPTDVVFAACVSNATTNTGTIWRNPDAGGSGTWTEVYSASTIQRISLAIAPSSQSTIYALTVTSGTSSDTYESALGAVLRSTSNGDPNTWTVQTSNQNPVLLNTLLLSYPEKSCNAQDSHSGQGSYDLYLAVDPTNPNRVWAQGIDVFRSDDGGMNWGVAGFYTGVGVNNIHPDNHVLVFSPGYNGTSNQTIYIGNDGGIYRSDSAAGAVTTGNQALCGPYTSGVTWTFVGNTYATTQFYHGDIFPGAAAYVGGTQDNGTEEGISALGPTEWGVIVGGDGGQTVVDPMNAATIFSEHFGATMLRSVDGGYSFSYLTLPTDNGFGAAGIDVIALDPSNTSRMYTGGYQLYRSTDSGTTWAAASASIDTTTYTGITAVAVSPADSNHVLFGTLTGEIYRSSAATTSTGTTVWAEAVPRAGVVSSIAYDPTNTNVAYATYSTFDQLSTDNHVYKTSDGGMTWKGIDGSGATGLPDLPVNTILVDPLAPTNLYAGSDMGVFVSLNAGATWSRDVSSISDTIISRLVLDRGSGVAKLFAFTFGRGVWEVTLPSSGTPCTYSVSPTTQTIGPGGGPQFITINTQAGCVWSATAFSFVIQFIPPASGVGPGKLYYQFLPDTAAYGFAQTIYVQGIPVQVQQTAGTPVTGNDEQASAANLGPLPAAAVGATSSWTSNASDPVHSCTNSHDNSTGWFRFTAPSAGPINLNLYSLTANYTDVGMVITAYAYSGTLGPELVCGKTTAGAAAAVMTVSFNATAGTTYLVELSAIGTGVGGTAVLNVAMAPPAGSITVTPGTSSIPSGGTQQFTAATTNTLSPAVRWTVTPSSVGHISASGLFSGTNPSGGSIAATITATSISNPSVTGSTTVNITALPISFQQSGVLNSASYQGPGVSPGEIITIFGNALGPSQLTLGTVTANGFLSTAAGGTEVLFDGKAAPVLYSLAGQVSAVVPYEVANQTSTQVQVSFNGQPSAAVAVPVVASAPGLFTANATGSGQASIVNQDGVINSAQFAAEPGAYVILFATGEGQTNPPGVTGQVNNSSTLPAPVQKVSLTIGGQPAQILYAGAAPGFVAGAMQINAIVPASVTPGTAVPVQLTVGNNSSAAGTTMSVLGNDGRQGYIAYTNNGSTALTINVYPTQISTKPVYTTTIAAGLGYGEQLGLGQYGNEAGIQVNNGPIRVLSQVCTYFSTNPPFWTCQGSAQKPFPN